MIYRDLIIESYKKREKGEEEESIQKWLESEKNILFEEFAFIAEVNIGGEYLPPESIERIKNIAKRKWIRHFDNTLGLSQDELERYTKTVLPIEETLLEDKEYHIIPRTRKTEEESKVYGFNVPIPKHLYNRGEIYNLSLTKGTLTHEERYKIQEHIMSSIKMLEKLPFPKGLTNVPLYAGAHHETLDGKGYPRGLKENELPLVSRIIAFADVFEALSASDRPYKKAKTLSECVKILSYMVKEKHLDREVFELFLTSGVYKRYAKLHLKEDQIDEVEIKECLQKT